MDTSRAEELWNLGETLSGAAGGWTAAERVDPFWEPMWATGSGAAWAKWDDVAAASPAIRLPRRLRISEENAWVVLESPRRWRALGSLLAVLHAYRTVTAEQAAALTGEPNLANPQTPLVAALFRLGVLDLGTSTSLLTAATPFGRTTLYRAARTTALTRLLELATWSEWLAITGGLPWAAAGRFDRHNVLATELALRVAEYCDIATVIGERFCDLRALTGTLDQRTNGRTTNQADLVVVRPDGLRIAVEMTASTGPGFAAKVERWARVLNAHPLGDSGCVVLFVICASPGPATARIEREVRSRIAEVVRRFPGTTYESISDRLAVARWDAYFPAAHTVDPGHFFGLRADMTAGMHARSMAWRSVELLDRRSLPYAPATNDVNAVLENLHLLWATPPWLRDPARAPRMDVVLNALDGIPDTVPYALPQRPERAKGHTPGTAKGAVGDTRWPKRLLPYR